MDLDPFTPGEQQAVNRSGFRGAKPECRAGRMCSLSLELRFPPFQEGPNAFSIVVAVIYLSSQTLDAFENIGGQGVPAGKKVELFLYNGNGERRTCRNPFCQICRELQ